MRVAGRDGVDSACGGGIRYRALLGDDYGGRRVRERIDEHDQVRPGQDTLRTRGSPVEPHLVLRLPEWRRGIAHRDRLAPAAAAHRVVGRECLGVARA